MNTSKPKHNYFFNFVYIFQVLYIFYIISSLIILEYESYFLLNKWTYEESFHRILGAILYLTGFIFFLICSLTNPGIITNENSKIHELSSPYDGIMFEKRICSTCNIQKPARSKHCKFCSFCVARFDHHCFVFNNCIGAYNFIYFFFFLLIHSSIFVYTLYITHYGLSNVIKQEHLLEAVFIHTQTNQQLSNSYFTISKYLFSKFSGTCSLFLISFFFSIGIIIYFIQYIYLHFYLNLTYNEYKKYRRLKEQFPALQKGFYNIGFKQNVKALLKYKKRIDDMKNKKSL